MIATTLCGGRQVRVFIHYFASHGPLMLPRCWLSIQCRSSQVSRCTQMLPDADAACPIMCVQYLTNSGPYFPVHLFFFPSCGFLLQSLRFISIMLVDFCLRLPFEVPSVVFTAGHVSQMCLCRVRLWIFTCFFSLPIPPSEMFLFG